MQPVAHAGLLGHEVLARLHQELQLEAPVDRADRRQVRLAQGHPGDGEGICGVALARSSRADALAPRELWGHLAHPSAGGDEEAGRGRALDLFLAGRGGQVWLLAAVSGLIFLGGLQAIPADLYESAALDGAGPRQRLTHITLPLLRPGIAATRAAHRETPRLPDGDQRIDYLQQSVDAVALEVERIGEAQRFNDKLRAERGETPPLKKQSPEE